MRKVLSIRQSPEALAAQYWSVVNRWDIERRARGRPADRRISRRDAEHELKRALAALKAQEARDA